MKKKKRRQKRLDDLGSAYSGGTSRRSALESRVNSEQVDDGFANHDVMSRVSHASGIDQSLSEKKLVDNSAFGFSPERRSGKPGTPEETLHKLKTIALRQVNE